MDTNQALQIFKPGRHISMAGAAISFSEADLAACAAAYDPARHEAPLVVGHPRHDAPAYGWVAGLSAANGLEAQPHQVDPAFAELVAAGRYKKISASFYAPDSPQNPVPGVYYLRHVGFLGAQPPAVKGLRAPSFAEDEQGIVEFGDWADAQNASLWRRLRDFFIAQFGLEQADSVIPDYTVANLEDEARRPESDANALPSPAFVEPSPQETSVTPEQAAALEAENLRLKNEIAERAARDKSAANAARHQANAAFAESLVSEGRLLPAQSLAVIATLDHLASQDAAVEFGEGDAKKPLIDVVRELLSAMPKQVEFGERATKDKAGAGRVDAGDATALASAALAFQEEEAKAGRVISITAAMQHTLKASGAK